MDAVLGLVIARHIERHDRAAYQQECDDDKDRDGNRVNEAALVVCLVEQCSHVIHGYQLGTASANKKGSMKPRSLVMLQVQPVFSYRCRYLTLRRPRPR